ncbi:uracil-DNA glycosylase family protein [uncultured Megasphaera sp.]|uniref:uracil-DNA glycosylase family protein n=1 Tax=uncultured Megasphaera sp. TaxID=165188 RepID=UPI0025FD75C9|nr:uracil-DNA glycosylase family protein [uncultured Megasphaera sp.]
MTLQEMIDKLKADERNQDYTARGIGPIFQIHEKAKILIIGQAPGKKVEESGIPFHDKSGEKLMAWMGIDSDTFYSQAISIMPMDFYYPGKAKTGDKAPRRFIAAEYHQALRQLMPEIEMTILIGNYAMKYYLKGRMERNLTETVRHYRDYLPDYFPIVHPSPLNFRWQAKNPWFEANVVPALQQRVYTLLK